MNLNANAWSCMKTAWAILWRQMPGHTWKQIQTTRAILSRMLYIIKTNQQFDSSTSRRRCSSANERETHSNLRFAPDSYWSLFPLRSLHFPSHNWQGATRIQSKGNMWPRLLQDCGTVSSSNEGSEELTLWPPSGSPLASSTLAPDVPGAL